MPIEAVMSKYFGDAEKNLATIFEFAKKLGRVIIFIDEIDTLAGNRDSFDMHEASRRILSTLLRKLDSFESSEDTLMICATNRKKDLDPAILSRMDMSIEFALPDDKARVEIFRRYAKHLEESELKLVSEKAENFSGRNIYEVCKDAERRWASKYIRGEVEDDLPKTEAYILAIQSRISQNLA